MIEPILMAAEDSSETLTTSVAKNYLAALVRTHGMAHATYVGLTVPGKTSESPIVWTTYDEAWQKHYSENNYARIDPVIAVERRSVLPVDWADIQSTNLTARRIFGEANEFGIGRQGLVIPVRGPRGDRGLFIVTSNASAAEWRGSKKSAMRDLVLIAQYVHQQAMTEADVYKSISQNFRLAPRETECLRWAAAGKSVIDTATILNISERVVRGYIDSARHKLNALNVAHAVSRAIGLGLIAPD